MANLIDFNIKHLAVMVACVHIMDVIIFQKMVAGIHLPLRSLCILCLLFQIGGRGKGSKHTRCLESINFTIFSFLQGAYITAVTETHAVNIRPSAFGRKLTLFNAIPLFT